MHKKKIIALIIGIITLSFVALQLLDFPDKSDSKQKYVHFSIDDVEDVFYDIISHKDKYGSIFDNPFLGRLHEYHRVYNAKFTLYTYQRTSSYDISDFPIKFKHEFIKNSSWLRFGFHWIEPIFCKDVSVAQFRRSLNAFNHSVINFAGNSSLTHTLRLHYFYASDSLLTCVNGGGWLCADEKGRLSYNLTKSESDFLWKHKHIVKDGRKYFSTDIRLEHHPLIIHELKRHQDRDTLVIFTHEWALGEQPFKTFLNHLLHERKIQINHVTNNNFEKTVKWLYDNEYTFTFLE